MASMKTVTPDQPQLVLAICDDRTRGEAAVRALRERGFTDEQVSVLFRHDDTNISAEQMIALDRATEAEGTAVALGSTVGGLAGLIGGLAMFSIPGIGPFLGVGVLATTIGGAALGAAAGERATHFKALGLPDERQARYGAALEAGSMIIAVQARNADEVMRARETLALHQADEIDVQPRHPA